MGITFVGKYPEHTRIQSGCLSLDFAVAGMGFDKKPHLGLPTRCGYHIYSSETGIGKTNFSLSLLGMIAAQTGGNIAIAAIDTFDPENMENILVHAGMTEKQEVEIVAEETHSKSLKRLNKALLTKKCVGSLLDSAYSCMSTAVEEGDPEDGNVGRDAKMISTYVRQAFHTVTTSKEDKTFVVTNMTFDDFNAPRLGFGPPPKKPARGKTLMGLTSIHIDLSQEYLRKKAVRDDIGRLLKGKVKKNNFGPTLREFHVYTLGGVGIHKGLTAIFDLLFMGDAEEQKDGRSYKVVLNGEFLEPLSYYIENWENEELFVPFLKVVDEKRNNLTTVEIKEPDFEQTPEELYEG